jgi:hypothetical protein
MTSIVYPSHSTHSNHWCHLKLEIYLISCEPYCTKWWDCEWWTEKGMDVIKDNFTIISLMTPRKSVIIVNLWVKIRILRLLYTSIMCWPLYCNIPYIPLYTYKSMRTRTHTNFKCNSEMTLNGWMWWFSLRICCTDVMRATCLVLHMSNKQWQQYLTDFLTLFACYK